MWVSTIASIVLQTAGRLVIGGRLYDRPLVTGSVLSLVGAAGSIVLLVFLVLGPDPRGTGFDRPA